MTVLTILFLYIPMSGLVLAFKDYHYNLGVFGSPWNGLENFKFFFISGAGLRVTLNTIGFNLLNIITSQGLAIVLAIVITEMSARIFTRITQSLIFLPYFISWIIVGTFVYSIFNYETGILNNFLTSIGKDAINVYAMPGAWKWIIMLINSWKWSGYYSIIYISAINGLDAQCYEAADIDGANVWQRILYITLPGIRSTISIMLLMQVGRILRGDFQMFYQVVGNNGQLYNATDVIDTFVFRSLVTSGDLGMTSAATFYQSLLCFVIIVVVNGIVRKVDKDNALF
ncbi:MAG: ABC transporter permease subunit [Gemmiger sp.]|nr:ABC transporter permease subunit [Gemmiger sp.]